MKAGPDGLDPRAYEVAVLVHLRDRLRAGDIWVEGSRAYRPSTITSCRGPPSPLRAEGRLGLAVPDTAAAWREARGGVCAKAEGRARRGRRGQLVDASLTEAGLQSRRSAARSATTPGPSPDGSTT